MNTAQTNITKILTFVNTIEQTQSMHKLSIVTL